MTGHRRVRHASTPPAPGPGALTTAALVFALLPALGAAPNAAASGATPSPTPTPVSTAASSSAASSSATPTPTDSGPTSAPAPAGTVTVTGTARVGETLTAVTEGWDPDLTLTFQWLVDGTPVADATRPTLALTAPQLSKQVSVVVTSYRGDTKIDEVTSDPVGPVAPGVFTSAPVPSIGGTLRVGRVLTADPGTWTPGATFAYQWLANGAPISGATARTYVLQATDRTKRISVAVTGSRSGYTSVKRTSALSTAVDWGVFTAAPTPVVSGAVQIGSTVTVTTGTWSPWATRTYQWRVDGKNVAGQTNHWFYLDATRLGHSVSVVVTARRPGFLTVVRTSGSRGPVTRPFTTAPTPKIAGFFRRVGQPISVSTGAWEPTALLAVQWRREGAAIQGATGRSYRPTTADLGKRLTVTVTGRRSGYTTTARTSAATPAILPPPYGFTTTGKPATPPVAAYAPASVKLITDAQWERIKAAGVWRSGDCPGYRTTFRRVEVPYWGFDGETHRGWVNVNADVTNSTAKIFNTLYAKRFPLHRVEGIEMFGGWDWLGSKANATTAFNCRRASEQNSPNGSSPYAWGRAIDLNPVQNPWINPRTGTWDPNAPAPSSAPGTIRYGGMVWTLLRSYNWYWSGTDEWKDYMHFDTGYPSRSKDGYVVTPDGDVLGRGPV
jgi:hypothetical protein